MSEQLSTEQFHRTIMQVRKELAAIQKVLGIQIERLTGQEEPKPPMCAFHVVNPFTHYLAQHAAEATETVFVPLIDRDGSGVLSGDGVEVQVCESHKRVLVEKYKGVTETNKVEK